VELECSLTAARDFDRSVSEDVNVPAAPAAGELFRLGIQIPVRHCMSRRIRLAFIVLCSILSAFSALASLGAYTSGDASGLQYILLTPAAIAAGLASVFAAGLLAELRFRTWPGWGNFLVPMAALLVALLPQVTGLGYDGSALDRPGSAVAGALLPLTVVVAVAMIRRLTPSAA
jgi:hypothetical protein